MRWITPGWSSFIRIAFSFITYACLPCLRTCPLLRIFLCDYVTTRESTGRHIIRTGRKRRQFSSTSPAQPAPDTINSAILCVRRRANLPIRPFADLIADRKVGYA